MSKKTISRYCPFKGIGAWDISILFFCTNHTQSVPRHWIMMHFCVRAIFLEINRCLSIKRILIIRQDHLSVFSEYARIILAYSQNTSRSSWRILRILQDHFGVFSVFAEFREHLSYSENTPDHLSVFSEYARIILAYSQNTPGSS